MIQLPHAHFRDRLTHFLTYADNNAGEIDNTAMQNQGPDFFLILRG